MIDRRLALGKCSPSADSMSKSLYLIKIAPSLAHRGRLDPSDDSEFFPASLLSMLSFILMASTTRPTALGKVLVSDIVIRTNLSVRACCCVYIFFAVKLLSAFTKSCSFGQALRTFGSRVNWLIHCTEICLFALKYKGSVRVDVPGIGCVRNACQDRMKRSAWRHQQ